MSSASATGEAGASAPGVEWDTAFPGISAALEQSRDQEITLDFVVEEPVQLREPRRKRAEAPAAETPPPGGEAPLPWLGGAAPQDQAAHDRGELLPESRLGPVDEPAGVGAVGPADLLETEGRGLRAGRRVRAGDVAIPRTVLTLWSLFILLALALAFIAGLLIGRFLWAPGISLRGDATGSEAGPRASASQPKPKS